MSLLMINTVDVIMSFYLAQTICGKVTLGRQYELFRLSTFLFKMREKILVIA